MSNWSFKSVRLGPEGAVNLVGLSLARAAKIQAYTRVLRVAARSKVANPSFSNYFVRESIGPHDGKPKPAGNIEYGFCQSLHGEESATTAFRTYYGRGGSRKPLLGIIAGSPGNIATPCGNCRDILLDDLGGDFEIVSGAADGGIAVVANMRDYLYPSFYKMPGSKIKPEVLTRIRFAIRDGELLVNDAYSPKDKHPERRYHALIATASDNFVGARDVMCEYHPIYALRDAVRQARRANFPFVQFVVIVCRDFGGGPPHVMYKDRQHLFELNLQAELLTGKQQNPPVYLATYLDQKTLTGVWKTSVKEWLPMPFSPRNFGPAFIEHLTKYFQGLESPER